MRVCFQHCRYRRREIPVAAVCKRAITTRRGPVLLQINELYEEVLHEILHCVGADKTCLNRENVIAFAREAFKIDPDVHDAVYRSVVEKEVSV